MKNSNTTARCILTGLIAILAAGMIYQQKVIISQNMQSRWHENRMEDIAKDQLQLLRTQMEDIAKDQLQLLRTQTDYLYITADSVTCGSEGFLHFLDDGAYTCLPQ